nr:allantoate deiminase [Quercus suber]
MIAKNFSHPRNSICEYSTCYKFKEQEDFKWEEENVSDADGYLERTFMSPASLRAGNLIRGWMEDAGLRTWVDHLGNLHGRVEGMNASAEALLICSHLDTVVDAGIFDGSLGIISALSALKVLNVNGMMGKLRRPIEVIAFSDEEGVRYGDEKLNYCICFPERTRGFQMGRRKFILDISEVDMDDDNDKKVAPRYFEAQSKLLKGCQQEQGTIGKNFSHPRFKYLWIIWI